MKYVVKLWKSGNSRVVTIPPAVIQAAGWTDKSTLRVYAQGKGQVVLQEIIWQDMQDGQTQEVHREQ